MRAHVVAHLHDAEGVEGTVKEHTWDANGELITGYSRNRLRACIAAAGAAAVVVTASLRLVAAHKQWNVPKI